MSTTSTPPLAGRREWMGLAVLAMPTLLVALDIGSLFLALPHMVRDLGASPVDQLWIMDAYGFMLAGLLITMGTLGDRIGRRRLLLIGGAAFGLASIVGALSVSPEMLIASRALLGIAGATLMPSTLALITNMFQDPKQRGVAISLWGTCQFGGAALGPALGGLLLNYFYWGSIFLMGVPVMVLLLVLGPVLLPEYRNPDADRLDLISVVLSLLAILPVIWGLKELALGSSDQTIPSIVAIGFGCVMGVAFIRRQLRSEDPLLDLRMFRSRPFSVVLVTMVLTGATLNGMGLIVTQYFQVVLGYLPSVSALAFAPMGLGLAVGAMLSPAVAKVVPSSVAIPGGLVLSIVGFVLLTQVSAGGGLFLIMAGIAIVALGDGPLVILGTGIVVGSAPPERAGSAASVSESSLHLGGTFGLAGFGTIAGVVYQSRLADTIPPGVSEAEAEAAEEGIANVAGVAAGLGDAAGPLLDAAYRAFTASLNLIGVLGALGFALLAVLVWSVLARESATRPAAPAAAAGVPSAGDEDQDGAGHDPAGATDSAATMSKQSKVS